MARLELCNLSKRYGDFNAVRDVTLDVADGEFLVLLGPSGCGKTTTLRMIAGFVEPTGGSVRIGENDVTLQPPWKRNTGLVFQNYALFPHLTVNQNVAFGLEMRKVSQSEIERRTAEALRLVRLDHLGERLPRQLSGGQQQRVALARALIFRPDVLLLGGPKFKMMGPLVFGQFQLNNWPFGAAVSFILMTSTLLLTASANILMQRRYRR